MHVSAFIHRVINNDLVFLPVRLQVIFLFFYRYVHVAFCDSEERVKPYSLVICSPGEEQTVQYTSAFQDAVRMLLTTMTEATALRPIQSHTCTSSHENNLSACRSDACVLKPGCVIPAGGTFEFLLHHALKQHGHSCSASNGGVSQILANALLSVPRQIYCHNPRRFLQTQTRVMSLISTQSHHFIPHNTAGDPERGEVPSKRLLVDLGLEAVSCKQQLILAVLQCLTSLLRVDAVLRTHAALRSPTHKLTNISEESPDETED